MTDAELIARLRSGATWDDDVAAADRIEDLIKFSSYWHNRSEELEAKLAKAVEIGNKMADSIDGNYYLPGVVKEWRATLAEIKGESHE